MPSSSATTMVVVMAQRAEVVLSGEERGVLERWARRPKSSQALAFRCRIVLAAADGMSSTDPGAAWLHGFDGREVAGAGCAPRPRRGGRRAAGRGGARALRARSGAATTTCATAPRTCTRRSMSLPAKFTPTYSSWLNLVERWFAELTSTWIKRGSHRSVRDLVASIRTWIANWNDDPKPFIWHKTADQILDSLAAYCQRINDSGH